MNEATPCHSGQEDGAGTIGLHMARVLFEKGAKVCITDNLSSGSL
jgi:UDP-glucose 4-epimerase